MQTFKRFSTAKKAAKGQPILVVGDIFIVGVTKEEGFLTEISILNGEGSVTGTVTARHLDRLGNANHAIATKAYHTKIWEHKA